MRSGWSASRLLGSAGQSQLLWETRSRRGGKGPLTEADTPASFARWVNPACLPLMCRARHGVRSWVFRSSWRRTGQHQAGGEGQTLS